MSGGFGKHNLGALLAAPKSGFLGTSGTAIYCDDLGGPLLAWGSTVPSDAAEGYAAGCIFIHTDLTGETDALYCNIGDYSSANFNPITVASD